MQTGETLVRGSRLVRLIGLGLLTWGCAEMPAQNSAGSTAGSGTQAMVDMAMQNMQRIMMMPESNRMQYVMTAQRDSVSHGQQLFDDTRLGTNGQACVTCHVGGGTTGGQIEMMPGMRMPIPDLHSVSDTFPKYKVPNDAVITLAEMNNNCLLMFQGGTPLPLNSQNARDLAAYVTSLSR